jgi:hypothetical protein
VAILGFFAIGLAAVGLPWSLWISFQTEAGSIGQVPVMAYAISLPLLAFLGLLLLHRVHPGWSIHWLAYAAGFPVAIFLVGGLICAAGSIGRRYHNRHDRKLTTG